MIDWFNLWLVVMAILLPLDLIALALLIWKTR